MTSSSIVMVVVSLALLAAAPSVLSSTQLGSLTEIIYLSLFAISFNILFGYTGMLSFGHSAGFGIGAYAFGVVLTFAPGLGTPLAGLVAIVLTCLCGLLIGASCVRLRGGYFALLTLAFAQFFYVAALVWKPVTRWGRRSPGPGRPNSPGREHCIVAVGHRNVILADAGGDRPRVLRRVLARSRRHLAARRFLNSGE